MGCGAFPGYAPRMSDTVESLERSELRGARVLVVDDDADSRLMLATVLEQSGAVVATAESAAEAMSAFERDPPQVLISDIGMPDEDGFTLLKKLRALPCPQGFRAIALTGYERSSQSGREAAAGFQAHLTKPVELTLMLATVVRMLQPSPPAPPGSLPPK
jgi:CheY-like chemotaxis protein